MWDEGNSRDFVDYGRYFVPERERQMAVVAGLIPATDEPFQVVELCCGEGLLAEVILDRYPACSLFGLDGSATMRRAARARLVRFGGRFRCRDFDLADSAWTDITGPIQAVVSSLCIHHLDGQGKQALFSQVHRALAPGGAFIVADLIQPAGDLGLESAAQGWDDAVRLQAARESDQQAIFDNFRQMQWNHFRTPDPFDKPSGLLEQLKWLESAGFVEVDVYWMEAGHAIYGGRQG